MTTTLKSLRISFDLKRFCTLRGKDDVRAVLVKTSSEIQPTRQITALPDKFRPVRAPLQRFEPRMRHNPTSHLTPSPTTNTHRAR